jgi:hypothetical protein
VWSEQQYGAKVRTTKQLSEIRHVARSVCWGRPACPLHAHSPHCWQNLNRMLPQPFLRTACARMCSMQSCLFQQ